MTDKKKKWINILTLAFTIACLPPVWAVVSGMFGMTVGSVALVVAGLYVAAGNDIKKAVPITIGFWCGDLWAVTATVIMERLKFNPNVELYCTLFVMGFLAVVIGSILERWIFVPAWLCGWAVGLIIIGALNPAEFGNLPVQIAIAMFAGVWYVGVAGDLFQKALIKFCVK